MALTKRPVGLLLIDLQKGFTEGCWRQSVPDEEVAPIKEAFQNCAQLLSCELKDVPLQMTRCYFGPGDFELDENVAKVLPPDQHYVIKPGTSVMHANGFKEWVHSKLLNNNIKTLVMGGCTTTSCVRVSSTATQMAFKSQGLQVVVDLNLCGARKENYIKRCYDCLAAYLDSRAFFCNYHKCPKCRIAQTLDLVSPVDNAIQDMRKAGVEVVECFDWNLYTS